MQHHDPTRDPSPRALSLFLPFYTPADPERAAELVECLRRNLDCPAFDRIYLLQDDDTALPFQDAKLTVLSLPGRPTYLDWVRYSQRLCPDHISVLANSDIYFEEDIAKLTELFAARAGSFVALSRYDMADGVVEPHPDPHWSQDTWAFLPGQPIPPEMAQQLRIPLGVPRCDNKIAYVFSINGFTVVNPFQDIRSIHLHQSGMRYYSKKGDSRIKGGMAMVHPSASLTAPAPLDIEIWSLNSAQYVEPKINRSLEKWRAERAAEKEASDRIFALDSDWQYPAITEQHAHARMREAVDGGVGLPEGTAYLGFPWATLIDLTAHARSRAEKIDQLRRHLERLAAAVAPYRRVITVCQHIRLLQYCDILTEAGVTDIFWSHCRSDMSHLPDRPDIALHPFPLFPVQQVPVSWSGIHAERPILFSFVGARSNQKYMTQTRSVILEALKDDPDGRIVDRDHWHFNKIVYDRQILDRAKPADGPLEDDAAAQEFRSILKDSLFTLCPSGTGPNSIRLWEAALSGSIPVVMSDHYRPPRDAELWAMATVTCAETPEAIRALPDRLRALRDDRPALRTRQLALYLLAQKYGPENFVHDIVNLF